MKEELVNKIIQGMLMILDNAQMSHLLEVLNYALFGYEICKMEGVEEEDIEQENKRVLDAFIAAKNIEGCSEKSLKYYRATIDAMLMTVKKGVLHITTEDLREYLTKYQEEKKSSKVTIDNIPRILSSFFTWMEDEDYILKSPVRRIHKIKAATVVKETYSDEDLEMMRDECENPRDLALVCKIAMTIFDKPRSKNQKFYSV